MRLQVFRGLFMQTSKRRKSPAYRKQKQRQRYARLKRVTVITAETSNTAKTNSTTQHMPVTQPLKNTNEINFVRSNKQQFRFVLIAFLVITIISLWIMQNSVIGYYQQTYHKNNDLNELKFYPWWQKGAQLGSQLNASINQINQNIKDINQNIITNFNENFAYDPTYLARKREQDKLLERKHQLAVQKASKENQIKTDFTLNDDDQVFFAGDSMMQGVAPHLQKWLSTKYSIKSVNLSKQSTGLTYNRFYDWNKTISDTLNSNSKIKILVIFLGPNDPWDMPNPEGGSFLRFKSPQWESIYRSRIKNIIDTAHRHQVTVLWLTPPNMRRDKLNEQMIYLRELINDEVSKNHGYVIDTRTILGNNGNQFSETKTDTNEQKVKTRSSDGIHFSVQGQKIIAQKILAYFNITSQTNPKGASDAF